MDTIGKKKAARNPRYDDYDCSAGCPVEAALEMISGKWKGLALYHLKDGPVRFNELKRRIGAVTQRTLTKQLRELEADGIIIRKMFPEVPPRVEYSLAEKGEGLIPIIMELRDWGVVHALKG